ncbi:unnamed protein product [Cyprideis torosa]|uniref:Uncharacterized protein n=1 Tax=Cyprideis torosa TaxID=163714 RepID=A0A7R8WDM6_9CRUS|nr:unnamed protein product [Cyprideis torosa]CAG0889718.1 unnamed protein product [Cyprideis torosa]
MTRMRGFRGSECINRGVTHNIKKPKKTLKKSITQNSVSVSRKRKLEGTLSNRSQPVAPPPPKKRVFDFKMSYSTPTKVALSSSDQNVANEVSPSTSTGDSSSASPTSQEATVPQQKTDLAVEEVESVEKMIQEFYGDTQKKTPPKKRFFKRKSPKKAIVRLSAGIEVGCRFKASPDKLHPSPKKVVLLDSSSPTSAAMTTAASPTICIPDTGNEITQVQSPTRTRNPLMSSVLTPLTPPSSNKKAALVRSRPMPSGIDWTVSSKDQDSSCTPPSAAMFKQLEEDDKGDMSPLLSAVSSCLSLSPSAGEQRLFPVFQRAEARSGCSPDRSGHGDATQRPRHLAPSKDKQGRCQMTLEAGQKSEVTQCQSCDFVYNSTDLDDVVAHAEHHDKVTGRNPALRYHCWKQERIHYVSAQAPKGSIVSVKATDPPSRWKMALEALEVCNSEIGWKGDQKSSATDSESCQMFLYIHDKKIIGILLAERISSAFRVIPNEGSLLVETEPCPARCGVSRLWVAEAWRQFGVARHLISVLMENFEGTALSCEDVALTSPTEAGRRFASKVLGERFKVYMYEKSECA